MEAIQLSEAQQELDSDAEFERYVEEQKHHFKAELLTGQKVKTTMGEVSIDDLIEEHSIAYALQQIEDIGKSL